MSNDKPWQGSKTQRGHGVPERNRALEDTVPVGHVSPSPGPQLESEELMTSAPLRTRPSSLENSGAVTLSGERVSEPLARELIVRRMAQQGITLRPDYAYGHDDLLVTLDGFDPDRQIGFQFVSHADADVVTDFDFQVEQRLRELSAQGIVQILVIHDYDAPDSDAVLSRVDGFLATAKLE